MRAFRTLYQSLDATTSTNEKVAALEGYFRSAPAEDAAWALALMTGRRPRRVVSAAAMVRWACEASGLEPWLFDECMMAVGDTAETISLVLDGVGFCARGADSGSRDGVANGPADRTREGDVGLAEWMEDRILPMRGMDEAEKRDRVVRWWRDQDQGTVFILCKLLTGGLRVGASKTLAVRGLAAALDRDVAAVGHRIMGDWRPTAGFMASLTRDVRTSDASEREAIERLSRPYPFYLASSIEAAPGAMEAFSSASNTPAGGSGGAVEAEGRYTAMGDAIGRVLGPIERFQIEWKWDGIRAQLIRRAGRTFLWSRGEELMTERFPEIVEGARRLPDGCVLDGEVLAWKNGRAMGFQSLQRRIARDDVSRGIRLGVPCVFMVYDVLEHEGIDVRGKPLADRRMMADGLIHAMNQGREDSSKLMLSERIRVDSWGEASRVRGGSRDRGVEGLMVKALDSPYRAGRVRGDWWKWKIEPYSADLVLVYAQPGHGRRAGLLTDYGFAAWDRGQLVAVTKAYSGLNQREIEELDGWIRANTRERFGPVRSVEAVHVFEIAFEGAALSGRNRSGIALRFPRISRWRRDKKPADADTLETIRTLVLAHETPKDANQDPGLFGQLG